MTRENKARVYMESQYSNLGHAKTGALYLASKVGIPGAKKAFKRRVINEGTNRIMSISTRLLADKLKLKRSKALASVQATKDILTSVGTPSLGKMLIK